MVLERNHSMHQSCQGTVLSLLTGMASLLLMSNPAPRNSLIGRMNQVKVLIVLAFDADGGLDPFSSTCITSSSIDIEVSNDIRLMTDEYQGIFPTLQENHNHPESISGICLSSIVDETEAIIKTQERDSESASYFARRVTLLWLLDFDACSNIHINDAGVCEFQRLSLRKFPWIGSDWPMKSLRSVRTLQSPVLPPPLSTKTLQAIQCWPFRSPYIYRI